MSARRRAGAKRKATGAGERWIDIVIGVVRDGDQLLVARREAGDSFGGYDEFPGGKREGDESLEAACVREVAEETGVAVRVEKLLAVAWHDGGDKNLALTFFQCRVDGAREPSEEARRLRSARWIPRRELATLRFPPANAGVVKQLLDEPAAAP